MKPADNSTAIALGAALLCVGTLVFQVATTHHRSSDPKRLASVPGVDDRAELESKFSALQKQMSQLRQATRELQAAETARAEQAEPSLTPVVDPGAAAELPAEIDLPDPRAPLVSAKVRNRDLVGRLEAQFFSEDVDAEWRQETLQQVQRVFETSAPGSRLLEADCATTMCRVVVAHDTEEARKGLAMQVTKMEPFIQGVLFDYDLEQRPSRTTMLVRRAGHDFVAARAQHSGP